MPQKLPTDEYIFLIWIRSLTDIERILLLEFVTTKNLFLLPMCAGILQKYPHSLLDLAVTVGGK